MFEMLAAAVLLSLGFTIGYILRGRRTHDLEELQQSLDKFDGKLEELEKSRIDSSASLRTQIGSLVDLQQSLQRETTKLAGALKSTTVRGRWGEIQLRRVVELAGMLNHCDFYEQATSEGGRHRPDLLVRLPAGRTIIVDAKAPLDAYLQANDAESEEQRVLLIQKHADQIRAHIKHLASKGYTEHFKPTPEFVVLFLPGEIFFSAALSADPTLIEIGAEQGIIIATPTTLISLLKAVFYGWRQESLSENARQVSELGCELYKRLATTAQHWQRVGKSLTNAVKSYNDAVGSLERRVLVKAREFEKLNVSTTGQLEELVPIEQIARSLQAKEMESEKAATPEI